jgi:hypothetical protein
VAQPKPVVTPEPHPLAAYIPADITDRYEVRNYRNAAQILATSAREQFAELLSAFRAFSLTTNDIRKPGGNESDIPKQLTTALSPLGWEETRIRADLHITKMSAHPVAAPPDDEDPAGPLQGVELEPIVRRNFLDGHMIDFVKGRVAFDVEWNSKDQTFDRDLVAFRAFHDCDLIDAAVILTRSADMNEVFVKLGPELDKDGKPRLDKNGKPKMLSSKYGASTTWMGKLVYRLDAGRQGGCPVLAIGITRRVITDWKDES